MTTLGGMGTIIFAIPPQNRPQEQDHALRGFAFPQVNLCALGRIRTCDTRFRRAVAGDRMAVTSVNVRQNWSQERPQSQQRLEFVPRTVPTLAPWFDYLG